MEVAVRGVRVRLAGYRLLHKLPLLVGAERGRPPRPADLHAGVRAGSMGADADVMGSTDCPQNFGQAFSNLQVSI